MEELKNKIKKEYLSGMKQKEICDKYDISINTLKSWIKRYNWVEEKRNKGAPKNNKGAPINFADKNNKHSKELEFNGIESNTTSNKVDNFKNNSTSLGGAPLGNKNALGNDGGAPFKNKNAVTTGEFETIFFDTLEGDELALIDKTPLEKMELLKQEIQLLTVRERRMLKRIEVLKSKEEVVINSETHGTQGDGEVSISNYESTLDVIQRVEDALTRVQDKKQKAIGSLHKFEIDEQKLELTVMKLELEIMKQGGQDEEVEDDGFMEALEAQVGDTWDD